METYVINALIVDTQTDNEVHKVKMIIQRRSYLEAYNYLLEKIKLLRYRMLSHSIVTADKESIGEVPALCEELPEPRPDPPKSSYDVLTDPSSFIAVQCMELTIHEDWGASTESKQSCNSGWEDDHYASYT